jgi:hypothetical protein
VQVRIKPVWLLVFIEAFTPFYLFQVFSVGIWFSTDYGVRLEISVR